MKICPEVEVCRVLRKWSSLIEIDAINSPASAIRFRLHAAFEFEAGWSRDGAVCVRHVRVKDNVSLDELEQLPGLHGRTGAVYTEEFARAHRAVLFNRSPP